MRQRKLTNIQWQFIRSSIFMCILTALFIITIIFINEPKDLLLLMKQQTWGTSVPVILSTLSAAVLIGSIVGYLNGNRLKKRLESLTQAILAFERGHFAHRISQSGEDELGQMGKQLNNMASMIEEQVASLQRLSSEKAEWNEALKQTAITKERQRLARELHDAVSQQLFAITMMTSAVSKTVLEQPVKAGEQMEIIEKMASEAQSEMRALLLHLRPTHLEGKRLKEGLDTLMNELKISQAIRINWKIDDIHDLTKGIEDHLFRIIQEAISNTLRHAQATEIHLTLYQVNDQVRLKMTDDGIGFHMDDKKAMSYGLRSMVERTNEIGGVIEIYSRQEKGTEIEVKVPLINKRGESDD